MCTSFTFQTKDFYCGRNMDLEYSFGKRVLIMPRNYPLMLRHGEAAVQHHAMIGMAAPGFAYPLYAEACNEKGLYMAGLNFPGNACYAAAEEGKERQIAVFELIPWLLGLCSTVEEACGRLKEIRVVNTPYAPELSPTSLHWHIADRNRSVVLELMEDGMHLHENPVGVMTNNPPFPFHLMNLNCYLNVTAGFPENRFGEGTQLHTFGEGMGGLGLPGDASSTSRFVRTAFLKANSQCGEGEQESVSQVFHILDGVAMVKGSVRNPQGKCEYTAYSCCINVDKGTYYYRTYGELGVYRASLMDADLNGEQLIDAEAAKC